MKSRSLLIWPFLGLTCLASAAPAASAQVETPTPAAGAAQLVPVPRFHFDAGAPLAAPAGVAADGTVCVGTVDGYVHALDADGSYRWSYTVRGAVTRRPLHVEKLWYVATSAERIYAFTEQGTLYWVFKPLSAVSSELAADSAGTLYFVGADRFLYGVSGHGSVSLRAPFGELAAGPSAAADGAIWAENRAGNVIRVRGQDVRRFAPQAPHEFEFSEPDTLRDPDGHLWHGRSDGIVEFRVSKDSTAQLVPLTASPLLAPAWSTASHQALFSARSGLVFALAPVQVHAQR